MAYTIAVSYDGNYTNAYINQGDVLSEMGRYTEAVKAYTRANETDPFNIAASDGLAVAKKGEAQSAEYDHSFRDRPYRRCGCPCLVYQIPETGRTDQRRRKRSKKK